MVKIFKFFGKILSTVFIITSISCSTLSDGDLYAEINADLENNPKLSQKQINTCVYEVKNGYVTIHVGGSGLSESALNQIKDGKNLRDVWMFTDKRVDVLFEVEETLKKKPAVKGVVWTSKNYGCQGRGIPITTIQATTLLLIFGFITFLLIIAIVGAVFFLVYRKRKQNV